MTAAALPGGAGAPPAESAPIDALECDLRALKSIHRHLCILSEDYGDDVAGQYLDDAASWSAQAIDRLAIIARSLQATTRPNDPTIQRPNH